MATMQNLCDRVRKRISDTQKARVPDATILQYLNDLQKIVYGQRPDFFVGAFPAGLADVVLSGTYPLPVFTEPWAVEYGVAMCNLPDDEEVRQAKAQDAEQRFIRYLYGPRA